MINIGEIIRDKMYNKKEDEGLDIKNLRCMNKALLAKQSWRHSTEKKTLWTKVVQHKKKSEEVSLYPN